MIKQIIPTEKHATSFFIKLIALNNPSDYSFNIYKKKQSVIQYHTPVLQKDKI